MIALYNCDKNRFKAFEPLIVRYTTLEPDAQIFFTFHRYEIQSNMLGALEISWLNEPANKTLLSFYLTCCPMNLLEFVTKVQTIQHCCKIHLRLELMILEMGFLFISQIKLIIYFYIYVTSMLIEHCLSLPSFCCFSGCLIKGRHIKALCISCQHNSLLYSSLYCLFLDAKEIHDKTHDFNLPLTLTF